uniref:FGENESH: predicted gene_3.414 protein n=1 Tax=Rhodotorula toruloides TaxID=5286 RepID=A0A0K3CBT6_RHOTO
MKSGKKTAPVYGGAQAAPRAVLPPPAALVPHTPRVVDKTSTPSNRLVISCDLELVLSDDTLKTRVSLPDVPRDGLWTCEVKREGEGIIFAVTHGALPFGALGRRVAVSLNFDWLDGPKSTRLRESKWSTPCPAPGEDRAQPGSVDKGWQSTITLSYAQARAPDRFDPAKPQIYRISLTLERLDVTQHVPEVLLSSIPSELIFQTPHLRRAEPFRRRSHLLANPHDVRFVFPEPGGELWARSDFFARSSPYFERILESDAAEAVAVPSKRARTSKGKSPATAVDADDEDVEDSDIETDELYFKEHPALKQEPPESPSPYKEIRITKTAFTTYRAVLAYLRTGHIAFAPLSSSFSIDADSEHTTRRQFIESAAASHGERPYLTSSKSTFRLASRLELEDLQSLCLASMSADLTPETAPHELFSDVSVAHASWRNTIIDFVVKHWVKVRATDAWKEVQGKVDADEVPGAAPIMMRLLLAKDGVKR